ncbi:hypothetical protein KDL01_41580, partial [Actinospica durhamensis]
SAQSPQPSEPAPLAPVGSGARAPVPGPASGLALPPDNAADAAATFTVPAPAAAPEASDSGWYNESVDVLLRLDQDAAEVIERRVVVCTAERLTELASSVSLPRALTDTSAEHGLHVELLYGGALIWQDHPSESHFRAAIELPAPLVAGDRHEYGLRLRTPPGQPMAPHFVHIPMHRTERCTLRIRFAADATPTRVWRLDAVPTSVVNDPWRGAALLEPDQFGELSAEFAHLRIGLAYGLSWQA